MYNMGMTEGCEVNAEKSRETEGRRGSRSMNVVQRQRVNKGLMLLVSVVL